MTFRSFDYGTASVPAQDDTNLAEIRNKKEKIKVVDDFIYLIITPILSF